jgi:hypothetical protein
LTICKILISSKFKIVRCLRQIDWNTNTVLKAKAMT